MIDKKLLNKPMNTDSVTKRVIRRIEDAIVAKELRPGDMLPTEIELSNNFGVGKSSIREAIKMLEALGVVRIKRGEGTFISQGGNSQLLNPLVFSLLLESGTSEEIMQLRQMIEPAYTVIAMESATEEDIEKIRQTIETFEENIKLNIQTQFNDIDFHEAILNATHNVYIIRIGEMMLKLFQASISNAVKDIPMTSLKDHRNIYNAILSKDEQKVRNAVIASFDGWRGYLEKEDN